MAIKASNQIAFTEQRKIVEIKKWYLATNENTGVTRDTDGWSEDVQKIDATKIYLWNWEEIIYSIGESDKSDPIIISSYGKGVSSVKNYYQITNSLVAPSVPNSNESSNWSDASITTNLSPTNKYLWNYTSIVYTDGSVTNTDPAIIGVYGDSGEDAVVFEIYSVQGFIFKEDMNEIELKIAAFQGTKRIEDALFTWEWFDQSLNNGKGEYVVILEDTDSDFIDISRKDEYAFAHLKCTMKYNENTYEDYVDLNNETVIYSSIVNFFGGTNIFDGSSQYLIAYIDLYRNNVLVETVSTNKYYIGENSVSDGIITTDASGSFEDGDLMYFICEKEISDLNKKIPYVILGEYKSGQWKISDVENKYVYVNDLYNFITKKQNEDVYKSVNSNVIVVSKESVARSRTVNFNIYKKQIGENNEFIINNELFLGVANATLIDVNDPIISADKPTNPNNGQVWLDTSVSPYQLYVYNKESDEWQYFTQQNGGSIYTSKPSSYQKGDLWILDDGEVCGDFGPGSMLKAIYDSTVFDNSHWVDAMGDNMEILNNLKQYLEFNSDTGLKIGQKDEKFYVNIGSIEMGFYDNSEGQNQKIVNISNNSANIQNAIFNGGNGTIFNNNAIFNQQINIKSSETSGFVWKTEENGSFTLAVI